MSATNRRGLERHPFDFYETPLHAYESLAEDLGINGKSEGFLLDAGCGNGAIGAHFATTYPKIEVVGVDIQPELVQIAHNRKLYNASFAVGDFCTWNSNIPKDGLSWVVMNPPYKHAMEFLERAVSLGNEKTQVAALLRVGFFEASPSTELGRKRQKFLDANPFDLLLLQRRPSFNGAGTDGTSYAWYIFGPGRGGLFRLQKNRGAND